MTRRVHVAEIEIEERYPVLTRGEWLIIARALLCYPETSLKLRKVAAIFLAENAA